MGPRTQPRTTGTRFLGCGHRAGVQEREVDSVTQVSPHCALFPRGYFCALEKFCPVAPACSQLSFRTRGPGGRALRRTSSALRGQEGGKSVLGESTRAQQVLGVLSCLEESTSEDRAVCEGRAPTVASPTLSCRRAGWRAPGARPGPAFWLGGPRQNPEAGKQGIQLGPASPEAARERGLSPQEGCKPWTCPACFGGCITANPSVCPWTPELLVGVGQSQLAPPLRPPLPPRPGASLCRNRAIVVRSDNRTSQNPDAQTGGDSTGLETTDVIKPTPRDA